MICKSVRRSVLWATATATAFAYLPAAAAAQEAPLAGDEIIVIGERANLLHIAGAGSTIEAEDLERARVLSVNEALRQAPGVYPRDEEGLGLRPNIGVRGLNPTRSSKVLLLEDGVPVAYAPYGDNATYSHPPIRRFERIEILRGASQIRFGPHTVGGVINYITPPAPEAFEGEVMAALGARGYGEFDASLGGQVAGTRLLAHGNYTQFDGVRDNANLQFDDLYFKAERTLAPGHELTVRVGRARENSQLTYSGLTQSEFDADPYGNPFANDRFDSERTTGSITHGWRVSDSLDLTTTLYALYFTRDWWRQSSNSGQRPNDASDAACGGMANLNTTCGIEGRLREYHHYGVDARLAWDTAIFSVPTEIQAGVRWHTERQNRLQVNADTPFSRTPGVSTNGGVIESNLRTAEALSAFAMGAFEIGDFTLSPGVRVESIDYERINRLTGARGESDLTEVIPGIGFTYAVRDDFVIYGGAHRGFSPPRVEDVVSNAGGVIELEAERSVNWELGVRGEAAPGVDVDVALFRMDFDNQIVPASVAGGVGSALTSAGETRHSGLEASVRASLRDMGVMTHDDIYIHGALTYVAEAEFVGARFSNISGFSGVSVSGNRLPYAPEWIGSITVGYERGDWLNLQAEVQYTDDMFTDDLNTVAPTANGQRGRIERATILNLTANVTPGGGRTTFFATLKNATDELYIVDRARGVLPGAPRLWQAGISYRF